MVVLSINKIEDMMKNLRNIRNMSVIAHVDHGKSTLTDLLVQDNGISATSRYMDTRKDEIARGITIKSAAVTMYTEIEEKLLKETMKEEDFNGNKFLINLIDSPGHVDFSSEVTAALRVTDGAIVVVDCIDSICVQTETVLRQAVDERIKPALVLNKLDRALLELESTPEELAKKLTNTVDMFNQKVEEYLGNDNTFKIKPLTPVDCNVSFFSGLQGWGFTLRTFSKFYLKKFKIETAEGEEKLRSLLWSQKVHFSSDDPWDTNGKLVKSPNPTKTFFITHVLNPIFKVKDLCNAGKIDEIKEYLKKFEIDFTGINLHGEGKPLFKVVMKHWLPGAQTLFDQIVTSLPSPVVSQSYRAEILYTGPKDDECYKAIANCDVSEDAPLMMYVSKMMPFADGRFIAFGRVFSGSVSTGLKVRIQGPEYVPGPGASDIAVKNIQRVVLMMGRTTSDISSCPAGNIIGLVGVDQVLKKTGTVTTNDKAFNIKTMKFSVSPIVKYSVYPKNPADMIKFQEGMDRLGKSDSLVVVNLSDKDEMTIAGAGELHLEICLNDLAEYAGCEICYDEPIVNYLEGVSKFVENKMAKSANKHNRITMSVETIPDEILENFENGKLVHKDPKERAQKFNELLSLKEDWIRKIMFHGPLSVGPNIMVDETRGVAHLHEIKDHMNAAFETLTKSGPLIGQPLRGVRFNVQDCVLHADAIHRTSPQIMTPTLRVCQGLMLSAEPILYEPVYAIEVQIPSECIGTVTSVLNERRGWMSNIESGATSRILYKGFLPVRESFGFNKIIMERTRGAASTSLTYSHYQTLPGSMTDKNSILYETVMKYREKKKVNTSLDADYYLDKL